MSIVISALDRYSAALEALKMHKETNSKVFAEHQTLLYSLIDAENFLRDSVATEKTGGQSGGVKVTYTPQTQTYADIEVIDALIAGGVIPASKRAEIVKTVDRPAKITISEQK